MPYSLWFMCPFRIPTRVRGVFSFNTRCEATNICSRLFPSDESLSHAAFAFIATTVSVANLQRANLERGGLKYSFATIFAPSQRSMNPIVVPVGTSRVQRLLHLDAKYETRELQYLVSGSQIPGCGPSWAAVSRTHQRTG